jgi:hypothetical protein
LNQTDRRILSLAWTGIGALVAWLVFTGALGYMVANGVSPNNAALYSVILAAIVFAGWLGSLRVVVKFPK